jgi:hypothetical protein
MASVRETKVRTSLASTNDTDIAEPLATATWIVSFMFVIFIMFRLFIQVGFQLSYVYCFCFIVFLHLTHQELKNSSMLI